MSFAIALVFVAVFEWLSLVAPVPLGGDTGTWTALSYPYVGYPHPSEITLFGYPPLMFPVLGFFVLVGGGPLVGPRLFAGFIGILLGLSTYVLGRSLFRFRVSALLAEALLFATTPFDRLFFFGGYPTLFALVFMNLALAFAVRYVRARRPSHAIYFWAATAATLLSHEFVGLALVVSLALIGFFLLVKRQFPWSIITSKAGAAGTAAAALAVGAFYLGVRFAHIAQNNYLATNALAHQRFLISAVLYPLRIQAFGGVIGYDLIKTDLGSFEIATAVMLLIFGLLISLAFLRPKLLTPSLIVIGSVVLAVLLMAIGGWLLYIFTDYRRFAYALYLPYVLAGVLLLDTVLHWCTPDTGSQPVRTSAGPSPPIGPRAHAFQLQHSPRGNARTPSLPTAVAVCGFVVVLIAGGLYTYPGLVAFQDQYNTSLHGWEYVHAMDAIQNSGVPGSILSWSAGPTLHWTFAMSNRNVYAPTIVSGFVFKQTRIQYDQLAYFPFHFWTATSNGLEFVGVPGNTTPFFTGSPIFGALRYGTPSQILDFSPTGFSVVLGNGTTVPAYTYGGPIPTISVVGSDPPSLVIRYDNPAFQLTVSSTSVAGGLTYVNTTVTATGSLGIRQLDEGIRQVPGVRVLPKTAIDGQSFSWNVGLTNYRSLVTEGTVAAPTTVSYGSLDAVSGASNLKFDARSPTVSRGSPSLNISIALSVPGANSLGSKLPALLDSRSILENWDVRFVLFNNIAKPLQAPIALFFEQEFGATLLFQENPWAVLLLPSTLP